MTVVLGLVAICNLNYINHLCFFVRVVEEPWVKYFS